MLRTSDVIPLYVRLGDWVGMLVVVLTLAARIPAQTPFPSMTRVGVDVGGRSPISSRST